jgi:hypothetical protein
MLIDDTRPSPEAVLSGEDRQFNVVLRCGIQEYSPVLLPRRRGEWREASRLLVKYMVRVAIDNEWDHAQ